MEKLSIKALLQRFRREEGGSVSLELVLMVPLLVWFVFATAAFFHAFQSKYVALKSSYTLADMFSRETGYITSGYMNNAHNLLDYMSMGANAPDFRVTVFTWSDSASKYTVQWSRERGGRGTYSSGSLNRQDDRLPILDDGERAILIETWSKYEPVIDYNIGLTNYDFPNFMVVSPRFAPQLCWNDTPRDHTKKVC
jgi:hypothetical protein